MPQFNINENALLNYRKVIQIQLEMRLIPSVYRV